MSFRDDVITNARERARRLEINGELWLVYEVGASYDRRGPSLVFECEQMFRRVRNFPHNWRDLPDAHLRLVMEQI